MGGVIQFPPRVPKIAGLTTGDIVTMKVREVVKELSRITGFDEEEVERMVLGAILDPSSLGEK